MALLLNARDLEDFFRSYSPERLRDVPVYLGKDPETHEALMRGLEDEFGAPRFFELSPYNFSGRGFDARAALYDGHLVPPVPTALPLDNLSKAAVLLPPSVQLELGETRAGSVATGKIHGAEAEFRDARRGTLLDWLCAELPTEGPLGTLRALREAGALVHVLMEGHSGDGGVSGRLTGVDSFFNVILTGVDGENLVIPGEHVLGVRPLRKYAH